MINGLIAHLWQSTLFAVGTWIAVLALRRNSARVRYWLWFTASVKFLIPFSLFVAIGSLVPHRAAAPQAQTQWTGPVVSAQPVVTFSGNMLPDVPSSRSRVYAWS